MKKITFVLIIVCGLFTSCKLRSIEGIRNNYIYENPRMIDGTFTVIQNGTQIHGLKCIYWSTTDDDSIFVANNGKKVFVNGSSIIIQE